MAHEWTKLFLTDFGRNFRSRVMSGEGIPYFSHAIVGEGKPESAEGIEQRTGLIYPYNRAIVKRCYVKADNQYMVVEINNQNPVLYDREALVTEVGVWARMQDEPEESEILYGYAYCLYGDVAMPPGTRGYAHQLVFNTKIANADNIIIQYDGSAVYLTHDEFNLALTNLEGYTRHEVDLMMSGLLKYRPVVTLDECVFPSYLTGAVQSLPCYAEKEGGLYPAQVEVKGVGYSVMAEKHEEVQ